MREAPLPVGVVGTQGRKNRMGYQMCDHTGEYDAHAFVEGWFVCDECFFKNCEQRPFEYGCPRCGNAESRCTCGT